MRNLLTATGCLATFACWLAAERSSAITPSPPTLDNEVPGAPETEPRSEAPVWHDGAVFFANRPFVRGTKDRQPLKYLNLYGQKVHTASRW